MYIFAYAYIYIHIYTYMFTPRLRARRGGALRGTIDFNLNDALHDFFHIYGLFVFEDRTTTSMF